MKTFQPPLDWKSAKWWANRSVEERTYFAAFPKIYRNMDLSTVHPEIAQRGLDWLNNQTDSPGLLITGKAGTGKTGLAQSLGREIISRQKKSVYFVAADRYVEMIKDSFDQDSNELPEMYAMPHLLRYIKDVFHVVIIDALGRERPTDFSQYELGALLRRRYEDCRQTIVTTSLSLSDIGHRYGDSARAVLCDMPSISLNGVL